MPASARSDGSRLTFSEKLSRLFIDIILHLSAASRGPQVQNQEFCFGVCPSRVLHLAPRSLRVFCSTLVITDGTPWDGPQPLRTLKTANLKTAP